MINVTSYENSVKQFTKPRNNPFDSTIQELVANYHEKGIAIENAYGFKEILTGSPAIYEDYKASLFGDIQDEDTRANLNTMMDHAKQAVLSGDLGITTESASGANVTTFAYLNGPVLRAIWARTFVPVVMKTVALKQTTYTATMDIPYYIGYDKEKHYLPYSMTPDELDEELAEDVLPVDPFNNLVAITCKANQALSAANPATDANGNIVFTNGKAKGNLLSLSTLVGQNETPSDTMHIDRRVFISDIKVAVATGDEPVSEIPTTGANVKTMGTQIPPSSKGNGKAGELMFIKTFKASATGIAGAKFFGDAVTDTSGSDPVTTYGGLEADDMETIQVMLDLETGDFVAFASSPSIISFKFDAMLSPEDNKTSAQIKQEQHSLEVMVGAGQHINITTTTELLQEYPTSHQGADYLVAMTDVVSEFFSGHLNLEYIQFAMDSMAGKHAKIVSPEVLRGKTITNGQFALRFAQGTNPNAYISEQLKKCISFYINNIRTYTRLDDGSWSIVGHANNVMHLNDFKHQNLAQVEGSEGIPEKTNLNMGFRVGYASGFVTDCIPGVVKYLYSPEFTMKQGLISMFTSMDDRRPTYIYHPFSYTISRGYLNPDNNLVPNVMVTKRHTFQEFVACMFKLKLVGNTAAQWSEPETYGHKTLS